MKNYVYLKKGISAKSTRNYYQLYVSDDNGFEKTLTFDTTLICALLDLTERSLLALDFEEAETVVDNKIIKSYVPIKVADLDINFNDE